ncbi:MAG: molecular chaperone TorD family protein [Candidatus Wallbacteria bacterium]|nr:molecular chaperone TorD family protein [Candidatus Wallbacteria bacterium]
MSEPGEEQVDADALAAAEGLSGFYLFLAGLFRRPPARDLMAMLAGEGPGNEVREMIGALAGAESAAALETAARQALGDVEGLRRDFEQLLSIPQAAYLAPYESAYRGQPAARTRGHGLLMGPHAREVAAQYRLAGLALSGESNELPDHVSLELEFLARCGEMEARNLRAGQQGTPEAAGWRTLRRRFLEEHVQAWVPRLCEEMERRASTAFYRAAARIVAGVLAFEAEAVPATDAPADRNEVSGQQAQDGRSRATPSVE